MDALDEKKNVVADKEKVEPKEKKKTPTLGQKIVEGRKKKGLSQEKFAELMGCSRQIVSRWELDSTVPRTQKIKKISNILGISIEELLGENKNNSENQDEKPVAKKRIKSLIKYIGIPILVLVILYFAYVGYKFMILNGISSKLEQYKNLDNYHFKMESYVNEEQTKEVWYKDGLYKICDTYFINNIKSTSARFIDVNQGNMYILNEQDKTYTVIQSIDNTEYNKGKYMYNSFPTTINSEFTKFNDIAFNLNFVYCYYKGNSLFLRIGNEVIELNKKNFEPIIHTITMKENSNIQLNYNKYFIELENVQNDDVKISSEYSRLD